jgi:hypothetical protein
MAPIAPKYYRWAILKALYDDHGIVPHTLYESEVEQKLGVPWSAAREDAKFLASKGYIIIATPQRGSRTYSRLTLDEQGWRFIEGGVIDTQIAVPDVASDTLVAAHMIHEAQEAARNLEKRIRERGKNLEILDLELARQGVANVDLLFRKRALQEDQDEDQARLQELRMQMVETQDHLQDGQNPVASEPGSDMGQTIHGSQQGINASIDLAFDHLPTGVLDLYDPQTMPCVRFKLSNRSAVPIRFTIESEIEDFSYKRVDSLDVAPGVECVAAQLPRLRRERSRALNEIRRAVLSTQVTYQRDEIEHPLLRQAFDLFLMARNVIRWAVPDAEHPGNWIPLLEHVAAWVTPRDETVKLVLREAAALHPDGVLVGYQGLHKLETARRQVQAIYEALKYKSKLTYISTTFAIGCGTADVIQAIRLPPESLHQRSANCIDGAVLYASLMEAVDLEPVLVLLSGHAFVGWKTWAGSQDYEFLETTVTLQAPFEEALDRGTVQYRQLLTDGWFDRPVFDPCGFARLLDIKALHDGIIHPMD